MNWLKSLDQSLFFLINSNHSAFMDSAMIWISSAWFWFASSMLVVLFVGFYQPFRSKRFVLGFLCVLTCSDLLTFRVFKLNIQRYRPCYFMEKEVRVTPKSCGGYFGFPSNHASNSFAMCFFIYLVCGNAYMLALLLLAFLVGYSRVYLGVHYPADIIVGFLVGGLVAFGVFVLLYKVRFLHLYRTKKSVFS